MSKVQEGQATPKANYKEIAKYVLRHENSALVIFLLGLMGIMSVVTKGLSLSRENLVNIVFQSAVRGVSAVGQGFVILTGGLDLSVGGIAVVSSLLGMTLMTANEWQNIAGHAFSPLLAFPIMIVIGAILGSANGLLVSRFRVPALIATLGIWQITYGVAFAISRGAMIYGAPMTIAFFGSGTVIGVPVPVIIFVITAVVAYFVLSRTTFGHAVYATGGNPVTACLSGVRVNHVELIVYVVSGITSGIAAIIMVSRFLSASLQSMSGLNLDSIASVFVGGVSISGGRGTVLGIVLGVLIIGVINNAMSLLGASQGLQGIAKGAIIVAAVAVDYWRRRH